MANQNNYILDVDDKSAQLNRNRFIISRVIDNGLNSLLTQMVPADLPDNFNVELTLYNLYNNTPTFHTVYDTEEFSELFKLVVLNYNEGYRRLLFIDFSKIRLPFATIFGQYQIILNFFEKEIGTEVNQILAIKRISSNRKEIELELLPEQRTEDNINLIKSFANSQITSNWIADAMLEVFNQPTSSTISIPTDNTFLTFDIIKDYLPPDIQSILDDENISEQFKQKIQIQAQNLLNKSYQLTSQSLSYSGSVKRFIEPDLSSTINASIRQSYTDYVQVPEFILV